MDEPVDAELAWRTAQEIAVAFGLPLELAMGEKDLLARHGAAEQAWFDREVRALNPCAVTC